MDQNTINKLKTAVQSSSILNNDEKTLFMDLLQHWPDNEIDSLIEVLGSSPPPNVEGARGRLQDKNNPSLSPSPHLGREMKKAASASGRGKPIPEGESIFDLRHRLEEDTVSFAHRRGTDAERAARKRHAEQTPIAEQKLATGQARKGEQKQKKETEISGSGVTNVDRSSVTIKGGTVNLGGGPEAAASQTHPQVTPSDSPLHKGERESVPQPMHSVIKIDRPVIQEINQPVIHRMVGTGGVSTQPIAKGVANIMVPHLQSIYQLAELTPDDIREGASFRNNLKVLLTFIKNAIEKEKVLPYHVIAEFEKSPLNRIFVQTGIGLLNDDSEDRDKVYKSVAGDIKKKFGDNVDTDEFEALIDFKDQLDQLM